MTSKDLTVGRIPSAPAARDLATDLDWLRKRAARFAARRRDAVDVDTLVSDGAEYLLDGNISRSTFDTTMRPLDPLTAFRVFAAVSLERHWSRITMRAKRDGLQTRMVADPQLDALQAPQPTPPSPRRTALLARLEQDQDPRALVLVELIRFVRVGHTFAEASRLAGCSAPHRASRLIIWARKRYGGGL